MASLLGCWWPLSPFISGAKMIVISSKLLSNIFHSIWEFLVAPSSSGHIFSVLLSREHKLMAKEHKLQMKRQFSSNMEGLYPSPEPVFRNSSQVFRYPEADKIPFTIACDFRHPDDFTKSRYLCCLPSTEHVTDSGTWSLCGPRSHHIYVYSWQLLWCHSAFLQLGVFGFLLNFARILNFLENVRCWNSHSGPLIRVSV